MRKFIADRSVDLVYLDPPFNSDSNYNLLFTTEGLQADEAQWTAFKDTWNWDIAAVASLNEIQDIPNVRLVSVVNAFQTFLGQTPMMAYVVNMAIRLFELHKKLKDTGSLYLHCDPTASHYLKLVLDAVFGPIQFRNEIIWRRTGSHNKSKRWAPLHDVILFYTKSDTFTWNNPRRPYMLGHVQEHFQPNGSGGYRTNYYGNVLTGSGTRNGESGRPWRGIDPTAKGRHWAIPSKLWEGTDVDPSGLSQHEKLDALYDAGAIRIDPGAAWPMYEREITRRDGPATSDIWAFQPYTGGTVFGSRDGIDEDIRWLSPQDSERLGYPTQKPVRLLTRIIEASSRPGDVVLDPFCGCGTTIEAAEKLKRSWIGIDISPFAIQLVRKVRLETAFPDLRAGQEYELLGLPTTLDGAKLLAEQDRKAFEIWSVSAIDGYPNEKGGADRGVDGRLAFKPDGKKSHFAVLSVKSGKLKADDIRSLIAVSNRERSTSAGFGVMISLAEPTTKMRADAASAGVFEVGGRKFPYVQILTIAELLDGVRPRLPFPDPMAAYRRAARVARQEELELE